MNVGAGPTLLLTRPGWKHDEEVDFLLKENTYLHHQPLLHAVDDAGRLESLLVLDGREGESSLNLCVVDIDVFGAPQFVAIIFHLKSR